MTVREFFRELRNIRIETATPVCRTVAEEIIGEVAPGARVFAAGESTGSSLILSIGGGSTEQQPALTFRIGAAGNATIRSSHPYGLYTLWRRIVEDWIDRDVAEFEPEVVLQPPVAWLRNLNDHLVGSLRTGRSFNRESYMRQLARDGFTHVSVNGLGVSRPFESGPPGDVYWWFYDYSPDIDQFVTAPLLHGYYPPDYLQANLRFLRENAALALKYGLTPGLHINSPRSLPDAFWDRYGFLRGARIDHPRESFRPRYTLAMAHPVVQQHYRTLVASLMREIPEIGFIHVWTNDSGSGFEYVSSLYAGRNGGPYLIREWKDDQEIARAAATNVMTYYRLLRDEARKVNPGFRLVCDLGPFHAERRFIIPELTDGIDAGSFGYFEKSVTGEEAAALKAGGARAHAKLDLTDGNVLGIPFPRLVFERISAAGAEHTFGILTNITPLSLAPFDINGEVIRELQLERGADIETILTKTARRWVGAEHAPQLIGAWNRVDRAVRAFPAGIPYSTFAFPWFRLWVRPFVPDIGKIPLPDRRYYEDFLLATFNNPTRVDLNNDMMWNFLDVEEAGEKVSQIDRDVIPPLNEAITICSTAASDARAPRHVFADLRDRLVALHCFYTTLRNTAAWIEAVHGHRKAVNPKARGAYREKVRSMVRSEIANARMLLTLWNESAVEFMPVSEAGETLHIYGDNFGDLVEKKIALMERHAEDEPFIDPDFMWRMPEEVGV